LLITFLSKDKEQNENVARKKKQKENKQNHVLKNILWTNQTKKQKLLPYKNRKSVK